MNRAVASIDAHRQASDGLSSREGAVSATDPGAVDILDEAAAEVGAAAKATQVGDVVLRLAGIDKSYPGVHALRSVSMSVRRGEVHALVGENGAGKSTLVGVAAGTVQPDKGRIEIDGESKSHPTPDWCRANGLAIVHQEPALLPDLSVAENLRLSMPAHKRPTVADQKTWAAGLLRPWRAAAVIEPYTYVRDLRPDERFVVEIAKALALEPGVLILDEPTEHLLPEGVTQLFASIQEVVTAGTAVIYISHRIREVKQVASTISVLRDGRMEGTFAAEHVTETEIVDLIVGRKLAARMPPKPKLDPQTPPVLQLERFAGAGHTDVWLTVRAGQIVGLAGIDGHGQRETMRSLAGLSKSAGVVKVHGRRASVNGARNASKSGFAYLTNDRHEEGILPGLSVGENMTVSALARVSRFGAVRPRRERSLIRSQIDTFNVKTPAMSTAIESLSGGNAQKVMLSRTMLTRSSVILADEPTQGVDVGSRAEIYSILRRAANDGAGVLVCSSDALELAGLCDQVVIFSRGHAVAVLDGDDVTERNITESALTATARRQRGDVSRRSTRSLPRWLRSDLAPSAVLAVLILVLGLVGASKNAFYLTERNFLLILPLFAVLAFVALGQQMVMMVGGIDLSVGPLIGFVSVLASYVMTPLQTSVGLILGLVLVIAAAAAVGVTNWFLVALLKINPLVATLVTYTALQGISLVLRPTPDGQFAPVISDTVARSFGFVPWVVVAAVVVALAMEVGLYRSIFGLRLRGVGSRAEVAKKVGVRSTTVLLAAYVGCSVLAAVAAVLFLPQVTSGNAASGQTYTLMSISAVVLGGASVFGGRGSYVGALFGAALIIQINTVVLFLGVADYWQQYVLGALTIAAAAFYSKTRASHGHS